MLVVVAECDNPTIGLAQIEDSTLKAKRLAAFILDQEPATELYRNALMWGN